MEMIEKYSQWVIIPIAVQPGKVMPIECRLPHNVMHCKGVAITLSDVNGYYLPLMLGEFNLIVNERREYPLNFQVEWKPWRFKMEQLLLKVNEPLTGGSRVTGFYYNHIPLAYTVKIYLQCVSERKKERTWTVLS